MQITRLPIEETISYKNHRFGYTDPPETIYMKTYTLILLTSFYCLTAKAQTLKSEKTDSMIRRHQPSYSLKEKRRISTVEIGYTSIIGWANPVMIGFSADFVQSYLLSPYVSVGGGVGGYIHDRYTGMIAAYADSRVYFRKSNVSAFFDLAFGYTSLLSDNDGIARNWPRSTLNHRYHTTMDASNGLLLNPAIGLRIFATKKYR